MPCRWIGWFIIVSLTSTMRRRSPYGNAAVRAGRTSAPSNDHMNRSMLPVRCSSISRPGSRDRAGRRTCADRHRSTRACRCRAGRCRDRRDSCRVSSRMSTQRRMSAPRPYFDWRDADSSHRRPCRAPLPSCACSASIRNHARASRVVHVHHVRMVSSRGSSAGTSACMPAAARACRAHSRCDRSTARRACTHCRPAAHDDVVGFGGGDTEFVDRTGSTSWPSAATTVIFRPGMRTSKIMDEPLMKRSRTFSPGMNRPVQFPAGFVPLIEIGIGATRHVSRSDGSMRMRFHMRRFANVSCKPLRCAVAYEVPPSAR